MSFVMRAAFRAPYLVAGRRPLVSNAPKLAATTPPAGPATAPCTQTVPSAPKLSTASPALNISAAEAWEQHNRRLNRPMSPHLTIYKFQLTSFMSITHRMTGLGLHVGLLAFSGATVLSAQSFPYYLALVAADPVGHGLLVTGKLLVGWAFSYHLLNGVRHLMWDIGQGFRLEAVYRSGYTVMAASLLMTAALMFI